MAFTLPWGVELTVEDRDAIPDDGHRHELLAGALLVTPVPGLPHQACVTVLLTILATASGPGHLVFIAPFDYQIDERTVLQPDVLVVRRSDIRGGRFVGTPLLVVEIHSPSTRLVDLHLKRAAYAKAGVPSYWLVDTEVPSITVLDLEGDTYTETATATGDASLEVTRPFPVTIVPRDLLQGLDA